MNMSQALGIRVQVKAMENFLDFISQFSDLIVMTRKILGIVRETMREIKCFIQHNIDWQFVAFLGVIPWKWTFHQQYRLPLVGTGENMWC